MQFHRDIDTKSLEHHYVAEASFGVEFHLAAVETRPLIRCWVYVLSSLFLDRKNNLARPENLNAAKDLDSRCRLDDAYDMEGRSGTGGYPTAQYSRAKPDPISPLQDLGNEPHRSVLLPLKYVRQRLCR